MKITKIDSFCINYPDCSANKKLKLRSGTGMGEKRLYMGSDEKKLDSFFELDNIESFLMLKEDLVKYIEDIGDEYNSPSQEYKNDIKIFYPDFLEKIRSIPFESLKINFVKKYDSQNRYYLGFAKDGYSGKNYNFFRDVALPKVTKLYFLKIKDNETQKMYIYIKPMYYRGEPTNDDQMNAIDMFAAANLSKQEYDEYIYIKTKVRRGQAKYREIALQRSPQCIFTGVDNEDLLIACHIKPHNKCNDDEKYDANNCLVMTPTYHLLFDLGLISFDENGKLLVSSLLDERNVLRLNLVKNKTYNFSRNSNIYLTYHRENVFKKFPDQKIIGAIKDQTN